MRMFIIAMRDIKANMYLPPIMVPNVNAALRDIRDAVNDTNNKEAWARHPEDFELWQLGEWESEDGSFQLGDKTTPYARQQLCAMQTLKD